MVTLLTPGSGSVKTLLIPFWYRSESTVPYHRLTDPVPDLALSVSDLQDANKKYCLHIYYAFYLLFKGTFTTFFKDKKT
jgi:hypothetical protein